MHFMNGMKRIVMDW